MSGKRYFKEHSELRNTFILNDSLNEVRVRDGKLYIFSSLGGPCAMDVLSADDAIGLGMIAQQMPGHVVTRSAPSLRGGQAR